jgi:hypothetical protein
VEVRGVVLRPGEPYELRLAGRGARGYVWTWQVTGDRDAVEVTERTPVVPASVVPGAALERAYVVRALRPGGRARVRFAQIRPPYPDEAPYEEFVLEVEVSAGP